MFVPIATRYIRHILSQSKYLGDFRLKIERLAHPRVTANVAHYTLSLMLERA